MSTSQTPYLDLKAGQTPQKLQAKSEDQILKAQHHAWRTVGPTVKPPGAWNSAQLGFCRKVPSGTFLTPPRVRSLERMEGRRPGVRGGAGLRPISPRAPERRGRGPPGALGSPAAFPSDMMPGKEDEKG